MKPILPATVVFALLIWSACQSNTQNVSAPPPPAAAPPASPKPEVYLYLVAFDKLNMREASNKNAKVITQLAEGEFVEGTGEVSQNREEVTLRDIPYDEPYFKVSTAGPDAKTGWIFSAALKPVYAGPRSTQPDLARLKQLSMFLKTLNVKKLDSGKKAVDFVQANFSSASGTLADAAFILLQGFLFRMETEGDYYSLTERQAWTDQDFEAVHRDNFDMKKYPLTRSLADNGFRLAEGEGMIFPVVDWKKLAAFFETKVTQPMKEYILQNLAEQKDVAFDDGGLIIGLDTLAERAVFWESFNKRNPYFVRSVETKESERWLRLVLLSGADNTPAFDYENQTVTEEYKKVWALIQQKYAGTELARKVKEFSDLCASEGGKRTKKVEDWITEYIESYNH